MKLVFATNNKNKAREIQEIVGDKHEILTLKDIGITEDIPEPFETLEENAMAKSDYVWERKQIAVFADDTGLEVNALNGEPGVYSARYAGEQRSADDNMDKLLAELKDKDDKSAQFRTVISFICEGEKYSFEGIVEGIIQERSGAKGFGYDPIFAPEGKNHSFAEMNTESKNAISHRGRAVRKFIAFLQELPE